MGESYTLVLPLSTFYCVLESIDIVLRGSYSLYLIPNPPYLSEIRTQIAGVARPRPKTGRCQTKATVSVAHMRY